MHDVAPRLLGLDATCLAAVHQAMEFIRSAPAAKAAVDIACFDILGKAKQKPLWQLLGDHTPGQLELPAVLPLVAPAEQAEKAAYWLRQGYRQIKVKLGGDYREDMERVRAVRREVGSGLEIRVDANQGWTLAQAMEMVPILKEAGVKVLEQPVPWWDMAAMAAINKEIPVMADESVLNLYDLQQVVGASAASWLNIKLMKCGGLLPGLGLAQQAREAGMPVLLGSMLESAVGSLAGAHFAAGVEGVVANEMVGPRLYARDTGEFPCIGNHIQLAKTPGLGFSPHWHHIDKLALFRTLIK